MPPMTALLEPAKKELGQALLESVRTEGAPSEFDTHFNDMSRKVISAMRADHGEVWAYKINLYEKDRGHKGGICRKIEEGETPLNFSCSFVAPVRDETIIDMIYDRDVAPYTGTAGDYKKVEAITNRVDEIGGTHLVWV